MCEVGELGQSDFQARIYNVRLFLIKIFNIYFCEYWNKRVQFVVLSKQMLIKSYIVALNVGALSFWNVSYVHLS